MKKILFTTAYSESSRNTWGYALRLARHFGAEITLMHVYEDATIALLPTNDFLGEDLYDKMEMFNASKLEDEKQRLREFISKNTPGDFKSIPLRSILRSGDVATEILEVERSGTFDLILLGTTTSSSLRDVLFGSTSLKVLTNARTSVFLVPPMASYFGIKKIVYATNFESGDLAAITHLKEWSAAFNCKIHLLHIFKDTRGAQKGAEQMKGLMQSFRQENEAGVLTARLLQGNVAKTIEKYLEQTGADMIALSPNKKGFFSQLFGSSVTTRIAKEAVVPILIHKEMEG